MEGRVEARHLGKVWAQGLQRPDGGHRRWVVERGQLGQAVQAVVDVPVEHDGVAEGGTAVHDAVPGDVDVGYGSQRVGEHGPHGGGLGSGQLAVREQRIVGPEHADLEAARPGIDHQHTHGPTMPRSDP